MVFAWGAVVPLVGAQEHWPDLLLGAVFSGTPVGYGAGTVLGGRLADRIPPRRICWAGLGVLAAGFAIAFAAPSGLTFVLAYALLALGVGGGLALTGAVAALAMVLPGRAGTVGGMASSAYAASAILQAPLVSALAPRLGWLGALQVVGTGTAVAAAALLLLMPALPARGRERTGRAGPAVARPVWTGAALALCGATFGSFAMVRLPGEALGGPALVGAVAAALAAGNAGGRLLGGLLADRLGAGRVMVAVYLLELLIAPALLVGVGPAAAIAAGLGAGLAVGGDAGSLSRIGRDAAPGRPNAAFGLVFAGFTAGAFAGPLLGAVVGTPLAWLVTAAPAAAGLALSAGRQAGPGRGPGR